MRAENCDRYGAEVYGERMSYDRICRRYVCDKCGGALGHTFVVEDRVACMRCGSQEIISESRYDQQRSDAIEHQYNRRRAGMPLQDVIEQDTGRLTVLGRVRLGWQEPNQSGQGQHAVASDHFVFRDTPVLENLFGDACSSLNIKFPFSDFDRNIVASYRVWAGGRTRGSGICLCEGDGAKVISALPFKVTEKQSGGVSVRRAAGDRRVSWGKAAIGFRWGKHEFKEGDEVPCPGRRGGLYPHCEACRPNILINFEIRHPELNVFGYWQVGTGSINNYKHLIAVWDKLTKTPEGERIPIPMNDVPFVLSIRPGSTIYQDQSKNWASREAFYLHLQLDPGVVKLLNGYRDRRFVALLQGRPLHQPPQLMSAQAEEPLPFDEPPVEEEYEDAEFEPVEEEPEPEAAPKTEVKQLPPPKNLTHKNIASLAVVLDGYDNQGQVKMAMLALYNAGWDKSTEWSPTEAWYQLQTHAQAG